MNAPTRDTAGERDDPITPAAGERIVARVLDLAAALRGAGVATTQAEAIDAARALAHVDLLEREQLREALASLLLSTHHHRPLFDELFDLHFPVRPLSGHAEAGAGDDDADDPDALLAEMVERLLEGSDADIRRMAREAVDAFGRVEGRDGAASYFQYRVMRAVDLPGLLRELLRRSGADEGRLTPMQERLLRDEFEARLRLLREEIEAEVRRRAVAERGVESIIARSVSSLPEDLDLLHTTAAEQAELTARVRPLARRLASRMAVKRRRGRDGRLDVRSTVRRSMSTGGVPFDPTFRPRRPHKPELFLVCDVSGSVASFARFTLMLVNALHGQFSKVRSFAFIDDLDEVTAMFAGGDLPEAVRRMHSEARLVAHDGHSDYGRALERFHREHARDVTARSTVIVLGDARTNYRGSGAWVLEDLARRARHVYWLNPEPTRFWDTGDSVASSYARHTEAMVEVRTMRQLAAFVEGVA